jgi:hypothetical protein
LDDPDSSALTSSSEQFFSEILTLSLDEVARGDTPRIGPEDPRHCSLLAEIEEELPPVIVHRESMCVIDGMHRLAAARRRGDTSIRARFFTGSREDAFLLAVRANTTHGKPLTLSERRRSAARILGTHGAWSDRAIAAVCGLSAGTVATLRRSTNPGQADQARIGRDGRAHPLDTSAARREAARLLREHPEASLREVAMATGLSPGTVRDVRQRITSGKPPEVVRSGPAPVAAAPTRLSLPLSERLRSDNALQATAEGRSVLDWLARRAVTPDEWEPLVPSVPKSRAYMVAEMARECARTWSEFADRLEEQCRRGA